MIRNFKDTFIGFSKETKVYGSLRSKSVEKNIQVDSIDGNT